MANLQFIPQENSKSVPAQLSLEEVPEEVRKEVEEVYATLKTNPGRMRVSFGTLAEMNTYESQVKAYCKLRPAGEIRFRRSPTKGLPKTTMDFRITDLLTANEEKTEEIREATEAVKTAAKK